MTVTTTATITVGQGNGATNTFNYDFLIPSTSAVAVSFTDADGITTSLSSTQYAISGIGNATGGSVVYPLVGSPIPVGSYITITRNLQLLQLVSISNQGAFYPRVVEAALDYLMMAIQQVNERITTIPIIPQPITMRQMKQALVNINQLYTIANLIPGNIADSVNIAWFSGFISPGDTMALFIQSTLSYSDNQMTLLFEAAALLPL